jgi:hypothetical protein
MIAGERDVRNDHAAKLRGTGELRKIEQVVV